MSNERQIAFLHGSMNQDYTGQYVRTDQGDVVERTNLRPNSIGGEKKANVKIIGNKLYEESLPDGDNKVIGWTNDYENKAIIYFIYNSEGYHCIFRYFINTKTIQRVWYAEQGLGLVDDNLSAEVVEGSLYWVNGDEEPKSFIIDKAVNYTADKSTTDFDAYSGLDAPFALNIFPLIRKPPRYAPTAEYGSVSAYRYNNIRKKSFQFKYCYEYSDNQRSAWSPISKIPLPKFELTYDGEWVLDLTVNNMIEVKVNTGTRQVERILVAARDCKDNNAGGFFIFDTIEKYAKDGTRLIDDNSSHFVQFLNNKHTESIDTDINNRYCDYVPLAAKDITLLDNKWLAMARPTLNYDGIDLDYTLETREQETTFEESAQYIYAYWEWRTLERFTSWGYTWVIDLPPTFPANKTVYLTFTFKGVKFEKTVITGDSYGDNYPQAFRDEFLDAIREFFQDNDFADNTNGDRGIQLEDSEATDNLFQTKDNKKHTTDFYYKISAPASSYVDVKKSLKRGQFHPFGIIYNDNFGRYNVVFADQEVYSPLVQDGVDDDMKYVVCDWKINHAPPDWATTYRWCYIKDRTYSYFIYLNKVKVISPSDASYPNVPNNKYFLDINGAINDTILTYPNTIISEYVWQNGDKVRVVGSEDAYELLEEHTLFPDTEEPYSALPALTGFLVDADISGGTGYTGVIEIFRQNEEPQETVYLEIGEEYAIVNGAHQGQIFNQVLGSQPATGTFNFGDVYFRMRFDQNGNAFPAESSHYSDYYISNSIDVGRAGAKINTEQKTLNRVIRGENFLENTEYNLLNVFMPDADYYSASDVDGDITAIKEVGDVLKIIQEHKETSIYIGQTRATDGDGNDIVLDSSKVFGTDRKYIEYRGSTYQRSVAVNDRYLYYFDEHTGEFIRSSANGQMAISSRYRMGSWFENMAKTLRSFNGDKDVIVSCDNDYGEVMVSFQIGRTMQSIVFLEEEENSGWIYFANMYSDVFFPENFAFQGDTMLSFKNGQLYVHGEGDLNVFYGEQRSCSLTYVVNIPAYTSKQLSNIRLSSTKNIWQVEFDVDDKGHYRRQSTILIPEQFEWINNRLHSAIYGNIRDKTGKADIQQLYKGEQLVGDFIYVKLSNYDNIDVILGENEVQFLINE